MTFQSNERRCRGGLMTAHWSLDIWREVFERPDTPPWPRRGGRASTKCPRSFDKRGRGGSFNLRLIGGLNQPLLLLRAIALALRARLRRLWRLRDIFLLAHPPLLGQGEEFSPLPDSPKKPRPPNV
jgi:hypothetical protein